MNNLIRRVSTSMGSLRSRVSSRASIISTTSTATNATTTTTTSTNVLQEMTMIPSAEFEQVSYKEKKEVLLMASIKAPLFEKKEEDKRAPVDICCVIDKSGSMAGSKLELVKEAMKFVIDNLEANDKLSVVLYDSNVSTLFDFTKMDAKNKENCKEKVSHINVGTSTNLSGGLFKGLDLCINRKSPNDVSSVLLFTDGLANVGVQNSSDICSQMLKLIEKMPSSRKSTVFTFGFGSDHNENMLRNIAEAGNGMYYFVGSTDAIPLSFADCLGGLQSIVAQNLSLSAKCLQGAKIIKSINPKYKVKEALPSSQVSLDLGDIYSEEGRDIIFLAEIPSLSAPNEESIAYVQFELKFFNTITVQDESCSCQVKIARPSKVDQSISPNKELDKQRNRLKAAEAMDESKKLAEQGKYEDAKKNLQKTKKEIMESVSQNDEYCQKLALEIDQCVSDVSDRDVYLDKGSKNISRKAQAHYYQRSNKIYDEDVSFYENPLKVEQKSKAKKGLF